MHHPSITVYQRSTIGECYHQQSQINQTPEKDETEVKASLPTKSSDLTDATAASMLTLLENATFASKGSVASTSRHI